MNRLTDEEVKNAIKDMEGWTIADEKWLRRRFRFPDFPKAIAFVNGVAEVSEEANHHPLISIDYRVVTMKLTSWHMKGITDLDIELIQKYDEIYKKVLSESGE